MDKELEEWICSFSGCDGGDINADTWLCGIEWGYKDATDERRTEYYERVLREEIEDGKVKLKEDYNLFEDEEQEHPFNLKAKKLYASIRGEEGGPGKLLKLNLSPIAFRGDRQDLWINNGLLEITGFEKKAEYVKALNKLSRFKDITTENEPKLIIGTGVGHRNNFAESFFGCDGSEFKNIKIEPQSEKNKGVRNIYYLKKGETLLVVVPFLGGPNGLNRDYLLEQVGKEIRSLLG